MASTDVETVGTGADKAKLAAAAALLVGGFAAFYLLAAQGALVQWLALLAAIGASVALIGVSDPGRRFVAYGRDSWKETKKVVWPTRRETLQMTGYVFAFVFVIALFLWLTDMTLQWVLYDLVLGWR